MLERSLFFLWAVLLVFSTCLLFLYKAPLQHAPDMVVQEVIAFILPTVIAFMLAMVLFFVSSTADSSWLYPVGTFLFGLVEVWIYWLFLMG